jgi:enamine deaminase RidA (YjgF/YER057c/UK114 family)
MDKEFLNPNDLPDWRPAFSQVVIVKAGGVRTIYVAGQVSVDAERKLVGAGDLKSQAELTTYLICDEQGDNDKVV